MENFGYVSLPDSMPLANPAFLNHAPSRPNTGPPNPVGFAAPPTHGKVDLFHNTCADCVHVAQKKSGLEQHASETEHSSFSCICGARFAKSFCLTRHVNAKIGPGFPCELCDKSFPRLDKMRDHLRSWHRLGATAFERYKSGDPSTNPIASAASGDYVLTQAEVPRPAYPAAAPGFDAMSMFSGCPPATNTAPNACSVQSGQSPESSTAAGCWWYSQPGHNTAYPC